MRKRPFNTFSDDYNSAKAREVGMKRDASGHQGSLDPRTGEVLKGRGYPTFFMTETVEEGRGNRVRYSPARGTYYSESKGDFPQQKAWLKRKKGLYRYKTTME